MTPPDNLRKAPSMSDVNALVAEWTAAMEGVPEREIERAFIVDGYGEAIQGEAVLYLPDDNEAEFRGAHAEVISAWFERCSPSGIRSLLALLAQQAARLEEVTRERDEVAEKARYAVMSMIFMPGVRAALDGMPEDDPVEPYLKRIRELEAAEAALAAAEAEKERAVADEREACAKLAYDLLVAQPEYDTFTAEYCDGHNDGSDAAQAAIAAAIRARAALSEKEQDR
jgi:hypothetical protein